MQARRAVISVVSWGLALAVSGCGGSGSGSGSIPAMGSGTTVTVTFTGPIPVVVATQVGAGSFTSAAPSSQVTFAVPSGTTKYAVAFLCPTAAGSPALNAETVVEATIQDGTTLTESCFGSPSTATATGNASSTIPGTTALEVIGGAGSAVFSNPASFSLPMTVGANDVAVIANGGSGILGVKIVRSQTVPGVVGGSGIVLTPLADATTTQSVTMTNVPAGFNPPNAVVNYHTANGTLFSLVNSASPSNPQPYAVVPAASTQSGDFYHYFGVAGAPFPGTQTLGMAMTTASGGGVTLALPAPWAFSGPAPAKLPTFTFNYSGFSGQAMVEDAALIVWSAGTTLINQIRVTATANFQNSTATITVPDLSSLPGFLAPAPTGTTINWIADIFAGTPQVLTTLTNPPANASGSFVQNTGQFTQP